MSKSEIIHLATFDIQVGLFTSEAKLLANLKKNGVTADAWSGSPANGFARVDEDADGVPFFSIVVGKRSSPALWAHECVHMADFIMDHLGIPTDVSNTEIRAILTQRLFEAVSEFRS